LGLQGSCAEGRFATSVQRATSRATGTNRANTRGVGACNVTGKCHAQANIYSAGQHRPIAAGESGRASAAQHGLAVVFARAGFGSRERGACCCSHIAESSARTIGRAEGGVCACERSAGTAGIAAASRECSNCRNVAGSSAGRRTTQGGRHRRAGRRSAICPTERDADGAIGSHHAGIGPQRLIARRTRAGRSAQDGSAECCDRATR
jgi:hypothetical protein